MANTTLERDSEIQVKQILSRAKSEPLKGRLYMYERYKQELQEVCVSSSQLGTATVELAKLLRV